VAAQLANCLKAVVCQHLLPRADAEGRVLATEILTMNHGHGPLHPRRRFSMMPGLMQIGAKDGMITIDDSLLHLLTTTTSSSMTLSPTAATRTSSGQHFAKHMKEKMQTQKKR